jgi:hypothetical protein
MIRKPHVYFLLSVLVIGCFISCQKREKTTQENVRGFKTASYTPFNKAVGGPLDSATAIKWQRTLLKQLQQSKTTAVTTVYYLPSAALKDLIQAANIAGICFYYGQDSAGLIHLVPVSVDTNGFAIHTPVVLTTNGQVSWQVAKQWRLRFMNQNPSGIWGHFWGSLAINRLLDQGGKLVRINLGLDDDGTQKIMFSNGDEVQPPGYEDRTMSCPPYCSAETIE